MNEPPHSPGSSHPPAAQGLYDPAHEHDACGVGFVVDIKGRKSHAIVTQALTVLKNLLHRGACGCEVNTGDGAGILIQMPHRFLARECAALGITLPEPGRYGAGLVFLPRDARDRAECRAILERIAVEEGQVPLGWRPVPTDSSPIGPTARSVEPTFEQVFIARGAGVPDRAAFERKLYVIRKRAEAEAAASGMANRGDFYIPSLGVTTIKAEYGEDWPQDIAHNLLGRKQSTEATNYLVDFRQELNLSRYLTGSLTSTRTNKYNPGSTLYATSSRTNTWDSGLDLNYTKNDTHATLSGSQTINTTGGISNPDQTNIQPEEQTVNSSAAFTFDRALSKSLTFRYNEGYTANKGGLGRRNLPADQEGRRKGYTSEDIQLAIFAVVGECAGFKLFPEIEMAQLDFRPQPDIAGEQSRQRRFGQRFQIAKEFEDPRARFSPAVRENVIEPEHVTLEKAVEMFRSGWNVVVGEKLPHETHVGAPGEF